MDKPTNEIVDKRLALYGDAVDVNIRIAQVWSGILGHEVKPVEVPLMMAGLKLVRAQVTPDYSDSSDDVHGWTTIFQLMVGEDMIHARTPDEYWAQKEGALQHCKNCGQQRWQHDDDTTCRPEAHWGYRFEAMP